MNGEVKAYRLNEPMTWEEFKAMPFDIQITYIQALQNKYHANDRMLAEMFNRHPTLITGYRKDILGIKGVGKGKGARPSEEQENDWNIWRAGAEQVKSLTEEEPEAPVEEPVEECIAAPIEETAVVEEYTPVTPPSVPTRQPYDTDAAAVESYRVSFRMVHSWDEFYELCSRFPFPDHPAQISLEVW